VVVDPVASLRLWPVNIVTPAGTFSIPALPATDWLYVLFDDWGNLNRLADLLRYPDRVRLEDAIFDEHLTHEDLFAAFTEALAVAGGRPWWQTFLLLGLAKGDWSKVHGRVLEGFDPGKVSLSAYLDRVYFALVEHADPKGRQRVDSYLETPPVGLKIELDEEKESNAFLAMLNQGR
jgi:hypothetical protein